MELVGIMFVFGLASGLFFYASLMNRLRLRNYQPAVVRSYVWKIGLGCVVLTMVIAMTVSSPR